MDQKGGNYASESNVGRVGEEEIKNLTFSRALTSLTVLVSRAMRLSLMDLATSCGVLGLKALKNENDMMIDDPFPLCRRWCGDGKENAAADAVFPLLPLNLLLFSISITHHRDHDLRVTITNNMEPDHRRAKES